MLQNTNKLTRREVLGTLGTVLATTAVVGLVSETAQAQVQSISFVIDTYQAYIRSSIQYNYDSFIFAYDTVKTRNVALFFMKDGQAIPANTVSDDLQIAKVYFPRNHFQEIKDFLRYEKPVRITVVKSNGIATLHNEDYELIGDLDI
jgi:hypothetical protein